MKRHVFRSILRLTLSAACVLCPLNVSAQWRPANKKIRSLCGYHSSARSGSQALKFGSNAEAKAAVDRILRVIGLTRDLVIEASDDVENAEAGIDGNNRRYIYYNPAFMERITNKARTDWAALAIMAHEIGHHLLGHRIENEGATPQEEEVIRHRQELAADKYSGFILRYMGASLRHAQSAVEAFGDDERSSTHPPMRERLDAIRAGWTEANDIVKGLTAVEEEASDRQPRPPAASAPEPLPRRVVSQPPRARAAREEQPITAYNTSTRLTQNRWEWVAFINAPPEVLEQIDYVEYLLHPTFQPSVVRVRERGASQPFAMKAVGWGTFQLRLRVVMKDGSSYNLTHQLRF